MDNKGVNTGLLTRYQQCTGCVEYVDKKTGQDANSLVLSRIRQLFESDPKKLENKNPEDLFDDIVARAYRDGTFSILGNDFTASVEARVYFDSKNELNWNDPKNYLKLRWTDNSQDQSFTDRGIDGIVEEATGVAPTERQPAFVERLRRMDRFYQAPLRMP